MTATTRTLRVDADLCQGHARCLMLVPEAFDFDEDTDLPTVKPEVARGEVPIDRLEYAVENCPERAISWHTAQ